VVLRPVQFAAYPVDPKLHSAANSGLSRAFYEAQLSVMREAFGSRLLVWDVFALNAGRPSNASFDHTCLVGGHSSSEVADAEVQALLWQLAQLPAVA
jgi:hypothetical protein